MSTTDGVYAVHETARDLAAHPDQLVAECPDLDGLLVALDHVRAARQWLAQVEHHVEDAATAQLRSTPNRVRTVDGIGTFTFQGGRDRTAWNHQDLAVEVVKRAFIDEATGEMADVPEAAWTAVHALLEAAGISRWRSGVLKPLGVPIDEFCTSMPARPTVRITPVEQP